jgi:hypothetical protein
MVCSDRVCAVAYEACGPLEEVEALGCDCGCGLQLLAWPEHDPGAEAGFLSLLPLEAY